MFTVQTKADSCKDTEMYLGTKMCFYLLSCKNIIYITVYQYDRLKL